jgi:hypothetical protein
VRKKKNTKFRAKRPLLDGLVVFLCLSGTFLGVYLFWQDMNRTLTKLSEIPVGIVSFKHNAAQRRFSDRLLWGQLQKEAPIYNGDLIRTADLSDTTITFANGDAIDLAENCLIQVFFSEKGARVELAEGMVNVNAKGDGLVLVSGDKEVSFTAGSVATVGADTNTQGFNLQVVEGNAALSTPTGTQTVMTGSAITVTADGTTAMNSQVVILSPVPNQRILNPSDALMPVTFSWQTVNFSGDEQVRLEIAGDRRFTRLIHTHDEDDHITATIELPSGIFWWRAYAVTPQAGGAEASAAAPAQAATGKLSVLYAPPPVLISPAEGAAYAYRVSPEAIRFQWANPPGADLDQATGYLLEAADNPARERPQLSTTVQGTSFLYAGLEPGTWYWRVRPVYPDEYTGTPVPSPWVSFGIEQRTESLTAPVLLSPAPGNMVNIATEERGIYFSWKHEPAAASYTIQIAEDQDLQYPVIIRTVRENFYAYTPEETSRNTSVLKDGRYFWRIYHTDLGGNTSPLSEVRSFIALKGNMNHETLFPPDNYTVADDVLPLFRFTWKTNLPFISRFQLSTTPDFSQLLVDAAVQNTAGERTYPGPALPEGIYYWRVATMIPPENSAAGETVLQTPPQRLVVVAPLPKPELEVPLDRVVPRPQENLAFRWRPVPGADVYEFSLYAAGSAEADPGAGRLRAGGSRLVYENPDARQSSLSIPMDSLTEGTYFWTVRAFAEERPHASRRQGALETGQFVLSKPRPILLEYPPGGHTFTGLEALRRPSTVRWSSTEPVGTSRFILSQNVNPLQGTPVLDVTNPGRAIPLPTLSAGTYYWTIRAETPEGIDISAPGPASFRVLPLEVPPVTLDFPPAGYTVTGLEALRRPGTVRWSSIEAVGTSRFILSQNPNPLQGDVILELTNPGRTIPLPRLSAGTYYWTIQAETSDGLNISAVQPASFQVLPPEVSRIILDYPEAGHPFTVLEVLRQTARIRWSSVETVGKSRLILSRDPDPLQGTAVLEVTNPGRSVNLTPLAPGTYYWTIQAETPEGLDISAVRPTSFQILPVSPVTLDYPETGYPFTGLEALRRPGTIRWSTTEAVGRSRFILSRNPDPLQGTPVQEILDPGRSIVLPPLTPGTYYWTIRAETSEGLDISAAKPSSFQVLPVAVSPVHLNFPTPGYAFTGLEALRRPGMVRWSSTETVGRSRFILSRSPNPLQGDAIQDVLDPGTAISLPPLAPGTYYWTIQAETPDGLDISAPQPLSFQVLPVSLLPPAQQMRPADGYRLDAAEVQKSRTITFTWDPVPGANAYIFTLVSDQHINDAPPIIRTDPLFKISYRIEDLSILDVGGFTWQVEALSIAADGTVEQRGTIGVSRFTIDIPPLSNPKLGVTGSLYGN